MFEKTLNLIILSFAIGIILTICLLLRGRFTINFENVFKSDLKIAKLDKKFVILYALLLFPGTIYIINNLSSDAIIYFYFFAGFLILSIGGYILTKSRTAVLFGLIYPILFFNYWNIYTFNLIAVLFVVSLILLMSNIIPWKILKLFVVLVLIMDITLVFITRDMVVLGTKIMSLQIPILIHIPIGNGIAIGLGDIFIAGLLCLQFTKEKGYTKNLSLGFIWITTALLFILLFILTLYLPERMYPATIFVALSFMGATILFKRFLTFILQLS